MRIHNSCNISCRNCTFSTLYYFWHMFLYLASTETFQQVGTIANGSYNKKLSVLQVNELLDEMKEELLFN